MSVARSGQPPIATLGLIPEAIHKWVRSNFDYKRCHLCNILLSLVNLSQKYTQPQKNCNKRFFDGFVFYYMSFVTLQKFTKIWPWEKVKFMSNPKWQKFAMKCMNNHYISIIGYFLGSKWHANIDKDKCTLYYMHILLDLSVFCSYCLITSSTMANNRVDFVI